MNKNELDPIESIKEIKNYMQKSSRFLSLSGWSGVWVGSCGIISGIIAIILKQETTTLYNETDLLLKFIALAIITLAVAIAGGIFFTLRKTKREGVNFINNVSKRMFINFAIPLIAGGVVCIALLTNGSAHLIASNMLVFYGLSMLMISRDTLAEIRILSLLEIILGLISLFFIKYSILFWIMGFGVLHILYGIILWKKYDSKKA